MQRTSTHLNPIFSSKDGWAPQRLAARDVHRSTVSNTSNINRLIPLLNQSRPSSKVRPESSGLLSTALLPTVRMVHLTRPHAEPSGKRLRLWTQPTQRKPAHTATRHDGYDRMARDVALRPLTPFVFVR